MQWILPNPFSGLKSGYAYEYEGNDYGSFHEPGDEEWDTVMLTNSEVRSAKYLGKRHIDGVQVRVYEIQVTDPQWGVRWVAQTDIG